MLPEEESQDGSCQLGQEDEEDEHEELSPVKTKIKCYAASSRRITVIYTVKYSTYTV